MSFELYILDMPYVITYLIHSPNITFYVNVVSILENKPESYEHRLGKVSQTFLCPFT
jgi:hypothetical protein